ncbi:MAG TPA: GNAT family N-acetyltransferase [Solirubrobacterales bacterium]|jgi:ribosomal protein S18 acetylase RimI-like enzyme|nr:GNAT family N-acetyltransferase [Solirubrobacterales bacterium]
MGYTRPKPLRGKHDFGDFCCGEADLDEWLRKYSRHAEHAGSARTFVSCLSGVVVGYYATAIGQVAPDDATERLLQGQAAGRPIPVIVLARLAVDQRHQRKGLGASLLHDALLTCVVIAERVGVAAVVAHTNDGAAGFYDNYGFEESPTDPLHRILLMKDMRVLLKEAGIDPAPAGPSG